MASVVDFIPATGIAKSVRLDGVTYPSIARAATALGCSKASLSIAIRENRGDQFVTDLKKRRAGLWVGSKWFATQTQVAEHLGVTPAAVNKAIKAGRPLEDLGMGRDHLRKEITIHGKTYASSFEAARATGYSDGHIRDMARQNRLDALAEKPREPRANLLTAAKPIAIRGFQYPSLKAAARELGLHPTTVFKHAANGNAEKLGFGPNRTSTRLRYKHWITAVRQLQPTEPVFEAELEAFAARLTSDVGHEVKPTTSAIRQALSGSPLCNQSMNGRIVSSIRRLMQRSAGTLERPVVQLEKPESDLDAEMVRMLVQIRLCTIDDAPEDAPAFADGADVTPDRLVALNIWATASLDVLS